MHIITVLNKLEDELVRFAAAHAAAPRAPDSPFGTLDHDSMALMMGELARAVGRVRNQCVSDSIVELQALLNESAPAGANPLLMAETVTPHPSTQPAVVPSSGLRIVKDGGDVRD